MSKIKPQKSMIIFEGLIYNILLTWLFFYLIDGLREMMRGLYGTSTLDLYYISIWLLPMMIIGTHLTTGSKCCYGFMVLSCLRWKEQFYNEEPSYILVGILLILPGLVLDYFFEFEQ